MNFQDLYLRSPIWGQNLLLNGYAIAISRHRYGRPLRSALAQLQEQERWPRDRLRAHQDERVRRVVAIAYQRSSYYRGIMDERGIRPSEIRGVTDLPKLPMLTKETVRERAPEMWTEKAPTRSWLKGHTSGTTGTPLDVWYDRASCVMNNGVYYRQKVWGGLEGGDWAGMVLGRVVAPPAQSQPPFWRVNRIHRQVWFSSFHLSEEHLGAYVQEIRRRRLQFLEGYPSTLFILANYLRRSGQTLPLRAVFTSSETLHRLQRETIEASFACRIFDFYGLAERVIFAAECEEHDGKHLAEEFGYTEVVDDEGQPVPDGKPGYLVGTSLHNVAMPMIRYRTNDVSRLLTEPCSCGRSLIRLADVATKAEDLVVTPDGRVISPSILTHPFKPFHQLQKSQIVQPDRDHLVVKLVKGDDFTEDHERALVSGLQARLGEGMAIDVEYVDDIPREKSGKYRWVISSVAHEYRVPWERINI